MTFDDVRRIALALPETGERVTWGSDLTFRVRDKIFVMSDVDSTHASIKASPESQAELIDLDPVTFKVAPYVGRFGWVVVDLERVDETLLTSLIREAWRRTAPKALARTLETGDGNR